MKLIFLDTETTGVKPTDHLFQVAYKVNGALDVNVGNFKPPVPISDEAMGVSYVTNEDVADCPAFQGSAMWEKLKEEIPQRILVAHNAQFDIGMLEKEGLTVAYHICTYKVAQFLMAAREESFSLQTLRFFFKIGMDKTFRDMYRPHTADADVVVLEQVFQRLFDMTKEFLKAEKGAEEMDDLHVLAQMVQISKMPIMLGLCNMKKYRGMKKTWEEVVRIDRGYAEYVLKGFELTSDIYHTVEYWWNEIYKCPKPPRNWDAPEFLAAKQQ